jgi:hypothetical protein
MSTPYKNALEAFRDSDEWRSCTEPSTIGATSKQRQYLENRLLRAFEKGWDAGYDAARAEFRDHGTRDP